MKTTLTEIIDFLKEWEMNEQCDATAEWNDQGRKNIATLNAVKISSAIGLIESITVSNNVELSTRP